MPSPVLSSEDPSPEGAPSPGWHHPGLQSGDISFYNMRNRSHIYTCPRSHFSGLLRLFFRLGSDDSPSSSTQHHGGPRGSPCLRVAWFSTGQGPTAATRTSSLVSEPSREGLAISAHTAQHPEDTAPPSGHIREHAPQAPGPPLQSQPISLHRLLL